jgi:hypothetical protein
LLWGAGELHYRSCIEAAEARFPVSPAPPVADANPFGDPDLNRVFGDSARRARANYERERRARRDAVHGCSRLPF